MGGADFATKNENNSAGFNLEWEVTDRFGLELDYHNSTGTTRAPTARTGRTRCSASRASTAALPRRTSARTSRCISVVLPAGQTGISPSLMQVTGSSFRNSYTKAEVEQTQLKGAFEFTESSKLDFGVASDGRQQPFGLRQRAVGQYLGRHSRRNAG